MRNITGFIRRNRFAINLAITLIAAIGVSMGVAHADESAIAHSTPSSHVYGTYQGKNPLYADRSLVIAPDSFKNRIRYWFVGPDGQPSVYFIMKKIGPNKYRELTVNADGEANQIILEGDTVTLQSRHVSKVVDSYIFVRN
ncbi:TPA: hypothetical protein ACIBRT_003776 [Salmonella enterica subsp. enterica serovar Aberdeen]